MFWCLHGWLICPLLINNMRERESVDIIWALTAFYVVSASQLITCRQNFGGMRLNQHLLKPCCWCQCDCLMARNIFSVTVVFYRRAVARPNVFFFKNSVISTITIRFIRTLPETYHISAHCPLQLLRNRMLSAQCLSHIHYGSVAYAILSIDSNRLSD